MKSLLFYFLQTIICSGILYGYYHILLRNKKFHLYNRYYLLFAATISIIIPLLNIPVYFTRPEDSSAFVQALTVFSSDNSQPVITTGSSTTTINSFFSWENILRTLYTAVASVIFIRFLIAIFHIIKLIKSYVAEKIDHIYFISTNEPGTPFSFFKWLFWNKKIDLDSEKGEQMFRHELFHIRQKHSLDIVFLEMLTVLFWINPFFHFIKKEIKAIHEFLADEFAINQNEKWNYAELLLMQVLKSPNHLLNPFFHNQIKRRIAMITSSKKPSYQYLRKIMVLPVAAIAIALFAFSYKQQKIAESKITIQDTIKQKERNPNEQSTVNKIADTIPKVLTNKDCLIVVDGKIKDSSSLKNINPNDISSINVLNADTAIAKYGDKGKNGVIEITTKHNPQPDNQITDTIPKLWAKSIYYNGPEKIILAADSLVFYPRPNINKVDIKKALIIIDGKKEPPEILKKKTIISNRITFYSKDTHTTIEKFGNDGQYGVIIFEKAVIIDTPPSEYYKDVLAKTEPAASHDNVFEQVEVDPSFPGGEGAWMEFLEHNLNIEIPIKFKAPAGAYTVWVQFIVDKDGNISSLKPLTNFGYGMEKEALKIMNLSPKWKPAKQNGQVVKAYKKQPITFFIKEKNHPTSNNEYPIPPNGDYNDPNFGKKWHEMISEIKAIAWKEEKAAYEYRGRTYIFGQIKNADSTVAAFTEQNGTGHMFLLNGKLIKSVNDLNALITRNDVRKFGFISQEETLKRFNQNDAIVFIETSNEPITKN